MLNRIHNINNHLHDTGDNGQAVSKELRYI